MIHDGVIGTAEDVVSYPFEAIGGFIGDGFVEASTSAGDAAGGFLGGLLGGLGDVIIKLAAIGVVAWIVAGAL